jgi:hypothetical protein
MPFTTQAELYSAIADWLDRDDLTTRIPDFVTLNEVAMNRIFNTAEMEVQTTLTCTPGQATVALPTGFMQIRRLRILVTDYYRDMQILPLEPSLDGGVVDGFPVAASVVGSSLYLKPAPNGAYTLLLNYYAKFAALTSSTTNWILDEHPDAYLYGSLLQSAPFLGTDERLPLWKQGFDNAVQQINEEDAAKRFGSMKLRADVALTYPPRFNVYTGWGR